ncbi:PREDICTED: E3 ubiquitin-protein ligase RNF19B [Colobus angolensis palliatus]|uniref:E3 ubiquitin-protein ligase RNF19B n=1 Tax=Colobus angolensis palliatus TaxID=336983 RepID=UPI0005F47B05|nr:PREDICTED: E3 ubiquitin-protein ligase RNF19B [Colobus angolensis palliatus]
MAIPGRARGPEGWGLPCKEAVGLVRVKKTLRELRQQLGSPPLRSRPLHRCGLRRNPGPSPGALPRGCGTRGAGTGWRGWPGGGDAGLPWKAREGRGGWSHGTATGRSRIGGLRSQASQRCLDFQALSGPLPWFERRRKALALPRAREDASRARSAVYAVIAYGCASCPKLTCEREGCQTEFCYHCKQIWHPNQTCDMARQQRAQTLRVRTKHTSGLSYGQESGPVCFTCSPSGCTFWGKKPWSRKKKILWQLGTLIGAPVGISLIAGIAIPAMVIGIPVYVGRKVNHSTSHSSIGVPIMLAYVYGVVPISLCRGGGCGVSTANGKGVKIEFDEDDGPITVADAWRALKNPSIGESSIEGLTSVLSTSGSPTDGLSVMQGPYSETASFAALSGGTLNGGILSSGKGKYSRLEVQADVQKEIFPKDTASLGAISDNASTRAMAGSIISSYNPQDRECNNMEIQVDIEAKPSHYQLVSGSSTEDSLHVHAQMAENEEEGNGGGGGEEDPPCRHQSCEQKDCLASKPWDISLAQPESIRSDLESSDTQSDDVPDITSDECGSPRSHTAACPSTPRAQGAPSPSAHMNLSALAEGQTVLKPEGGEARV